MDRLVMRYRLDSSVRRTGGVVIGGSPLKLFRVTPAGSQVIESIANGDAVADSELVTALVESGAIHPDPDPARARFASDDVLTVIPVHAKHQRHVPHLANGDRTIVVDDASPLRVPNAAIRFEDNRGAGAARNAGLAMVTTPLVAFVDADVELAPNWLDALLPHFDDPRVALVAPRVVTPDEGSPTALYEHQHSPLDLGPEPARIRQGTRVSYVPAAAIVCRTDAVRAVGGFDETLRYGEDVDLVWRLDAAGWHCRYEPRSVVLHEPRPSWAAWVQQRITYGSSAAPLACRHPGALAPVRVSAWSAAAWVAATLVRPPAGVVVGGALSGGSAAALVRKLADVPPGDAFLLAWRGNMRAGAQLANAIRRAWWPLLAVAALRWRGPRRALVLAALAARHPIRLADDVAYSLGVWRGMLTERTLQPLVPDLTSWPGKQHASSTRPRRARSGTSAKYGPSA